MQREQLSELDIEISPKETQPFPTLDICPYETLETKAQKELWFAVNDFVTELSTVYRKKFSDILTSYRYGSGIKIGKNIREFLQNHGMEYPDFVFRFGREAEDLLNSVGLDFTVNKPIPKDKGVLLFQLPKPLAKFWEKSSYRKEIGGTAIEWGKFYDQLMPAVWEVRDRFEWEDNKLFFERLNESGEHDPDEYYYVWLVEK
ncbi:MAG: hypothetical protein FJ044_05360 [Candidatus Cloacimonetes bacterium]|nr:hypothetical protein [Candidatus Cloacimonadota bacterium]